MVSSEAPSTTSGGAEKFYLELSKKLIAHKCNVAIALGNAHSDFQKIRFYRILKRDNKYLRKIFFDYFFPRNIRKLKEIIDDFKPDIIHFHNIYGISSQLINYVSKKLPTLVTVHDFWPICYHSGLTINGEICNLKCRKCTFPLALLSRKIRKKHLSKTLLIAPSEFLKEKFIASGFKNIKLIPNGVDIPKHIAPINKRLIYVGRLTKLKGIEKLLKALDDSKYPIDIYGEGPLKGILQEKYHNYSNIRFHGYWKNMGEVYKKGGILLFYSLMAENLPYVLIEAMAFGLPIIARNFGTVNQILTADQTALLFEIEKPNDLLTKIELLMKNEKLYLKLRNNAREVAVMKYDWKIILKEYLKTYDNLIKKKSN